MLSLSLDGVVALDDGMNLKGSRSEALGFRRDGVREAACFDLRFIALINPDIARCWIALVTEARETGILLGGSSISLEIAESPISGVELELQNSGDAFLGISKDLTNLRKADSLMVKWGYLNQANRGISRELFANLRRCC